jgi:dipeptidyl-peptidase-4
MLTVERITAQPSPSGTAPSRPEWSPDSRVLAFLWNDAGMPVRDIWLVARDSSTPRRLTGTGRAANAGSGIAEFVWLPGAGALAYLQAGDIWRIAASGGVPERLTTDGGAKADLAVSPDGRLLSFRRGGDLWVVSTADRAVRQLTRVGVPTIASQQLGTYARAEVEIGSYVWGGPTYSWSPDGRWIAAHYVDRRHVRKTPFPYYLGEETSVNVLRRGYPGDSNEVRKLGVVEVATGTMRLLDFPDPTTIRIAGFAWSPDGKLLVDRESDLAIDRWLDIVDPVTATHRPAWHDRRETRVYTDGSSAWHPDGRRLLLVSDLEDRYRIFAVTPGDTVATPLSPATSDVTSEPVPLPGSKEILYVSNEASPYERQVYRIPERGGAVVRITRRAGTHVPFVSPDGSTVALLSSDDVTPTELYLVDSRGSAPERRITRSVPGDFAAAKWVAPRYVSFKSRADAFTLHARILEPAAREPGRRYPVVFGPVYSNTVRNRWNGNNGLLQQLMVQRGYIVVQVDVRGSTGYGRAFREAFLMDWGGQDLEDLQSTVEYLKTLPHVDGERMGIWGSSYGGTLTVYSLLKKPGLFQAGVAAAPATEPRFFGVDDVAITRTPKSHPETFRRGALQYAKNLKDHLLIIHGMADDVVPFKTSVDLAEELMRQGKDFDFAFAPAATHGWSQRDYYATYFYRKLLQHFDRYIGSPAAGPPVQ